MGDNDSDGGHVVWNTTKDMYVVVAQPITPLSVLFACLMTVCIVVTVVGNVLVILSVFTYRPLRHVPNFYIVSLAIADLAVAILVMPYNVVYSMLGYWPFGSPFCLVWTTCDILTCTASILHLCAIAVDRYRAIHDPITYAQKRTIRRVLISVFVVWFVSGLISIPPLLGWNDSGLFDEETYQCQLTKDPGFVVYSASGSFYVPLVVMVFVYIKIYLATRARLRARASSAFLAGTSIRMTNFALATAAAGKTEIRETPEVGGNENDAIEAEVPEQADEAAQPTGNGDPSGGDLALRRSLINGLSPRRFREVIVDSTRRYKSRRGLVDDDLPSGSLRETGTGSHLTQFLAEKQRISLSRERRAARTMAVVMGAFVLCWLPFFLMYVTMSFCERCDRETDPRVVNFIVWLGYINSALNPLIYTVFNVDFRRAFSVLLRPRCRAVPAAAL